MLRLLTAFIAGLGMGLGMIIAGMANPEKVLAFLDLAGPWDPSLALVMVAAIAVALPAFRFAKKRHTALLGEAIQLPTTRRIDARLIGGSLIFGVGWGLAGICPGPALILLGKGLVKGLIFCSAMLAGFLLYQLIERFFSTRSFY